MPVLITEANGRNGPYLKPVLRTLDDLPHALDWFRMNGKRISLSPHEFTLAAVNNKLNQLAAPSQQKKKLSPKRKALNKAVRTLTGTAPDAAKRRKIERFARLAGLEPDFLFLSAEVSHAQETRSQAETTGQEKRSG